MTRSITLASVFQAPAPAAVLAPPTLLPPQLTGTSVMLTWTANPNTTYRLEYKPDLKSTNWNAVPGDVTAASNTLSKLDALTSSPRFFRVRVISR